MGTQEQMEAQEKIESGGASSKDTEMHKKLKEAEKKAVRLEAKLKDQKAAELQFAEEAQQAKAELMRKDLLLGKTTHHASELEKTLEKEVAGAKKAKEAEKLLKESKDTLEKLQADIRFIADKL